MGTLIFGIWLAIDLDAYKVWDGWILAAIVLWAIAAGAGQRGGEAYGQAAKLAAELSSQGRAEEPSGELKTLLQDRRAMWLNIVSSALVLAILVLMIYKPGA
jgi:hypothetical protein